MAKTVKSNKRADRRAMPEDLAIDSSSKTDRDSGKAIVAEAIAKMKVREGDHDDLDDIIATKTTLSGGGITKRGHQSSKQKLRRKKAMERAFETQEQLAHKTETSKMRFKKVNKNRKATWDETNEKLEAEKRHKMKDAREKAEKEKAAKNAFALLEESEA
ncbi:hypothetical protein CJU90_0981 [Yarrowia sp. C11]|nr:hypothetical protein CKK34_2394 [Yarrowia sp. E02]KAG5373291.1 hypothetical protein CJU90_0981 [Yarrowia sp. C11]